MSINLEYKKSVDELCNATINVSALDIMKKATEYSDKDNLVKFAKPAKKNVYARASMLGKVAIIILAVTICFSTAVLAAGVAGYGPFAKIFEKNLGDKKSADLIEEGYFMKVDETRIFGNFEFNFKGITGDLSSPMLLFSVRVNDEKFVANNKDFCVTLYPGQSEENYDKYRIDVVGYDYEGTRYCFDEVKAVQDENDPSLYYFSCPGLGMFMSNEEVFVVGIRSIRTECTCYTWDEEIMIKDVEYRKIIKHKDKVLIENVEVYFGNYGPSTTTDKMYEYEEVPVITSPNGLEYEVKNAIFGEYKTTMEFGYNFTGYDFVEGEKDYSKLEDKLQQEWMDTMGNAKIVVDGIEYEATFKGKTWCDTQGETGVVNNCNVMQIFPEIDFEGAKEVMFVANDGQAVILKSENN